MSGCIIKSNLKIDSESASWIVRCSTGKEAGWKSARGYYMVFVAGRTWYAHRIVAFLSGTITYEELENSSLIIDHIDGNKQNNCPSNLRKGDQRSNMSNMICHREGKLVGAFFDKNLVKWRGQIHKGGKNLYLGTFDTELEAHEAYLEARGKING